MNVRHLKHYIKTSCEGMSALAKMTSAIRDILYPVVEKSLKAHMKEYKTALSRFISNRTKELYDTAPCDRMIFGRSEIDDFFNALKIEESFVTSVLDKTYYGDINLSDFCKAAKDEFTVTMMCIIRYFVMKNDKKEIELASIYLAFSGKFYPSIHYKCFPKVQPSEYRYVMDYVVNNVLTNKYDLKRTGSVIGAVTCLTNSWVDAYRSSFKDFMDDDIVYIIQQLHSRMSSFMKNIASEYYKAYENKDKEYMSYTSDSFDEDNYHLADSDSQRAERIAEKTISYMHTSGVDYHVCQMAADNNVRTNEVRSIIEGIVTDPENSAEIAELIRLIITQYFLHSKSKDVTDIEFITFSIAPKPNAKDKDILREKEIVEGWLTDTSPSYRKRKSRVATRSSYHKSIFTYFTLMIHNANK